METINNEKATELNEGEEENKKVKQSLKFKEKIIKDSIVNTSNFFNTNYLNKKSNILNSNKLDFKIDTAGLINYFNSADDNTEKNYKTVDDESDSNNKIINLKVLKNKFLDEYKPFLELNNSNAEKNQSNKNLNTKSNNSSKILTYGEYKKLNNYSSSNNSNLLNELNKVKEDLNTGIKNDNTISAVAEYNSNNIISSLPNKYRLKNDDKENSNNSNLMLSLYQNYKTVVNTKDTKSDSVSHKPWRLYRVISAHTGWVRCIDVDPTNNW